jgi:hypothetical protein
LRFLWGDGGGFGGVASADGSRARGGSGRIGLVAIFIAALVISAVAIGRLTDDRGLGRYRPWLSEKLSLLHTLDPKANVVFIGASATTYDVVPAVVDDAAAEAGCPFRSVNLAMPGSSAFELAFMLDAIFDAGYPNGTIVVYDILAVAPVDFDEIHGTGRRSIAARLAYLPDAVRSAAGSPEPVRAAANFLRAALGEFLGIHRLHDLFLAEGASRYPAALKKAYVAERGYVPLELDAEYSGTVRQQRAEFLSPEGQAEFAAALRLWDRPADGRRAAVANRFAGRIRAAGMVPVAFAAPFRYPSLADAIEKARAADPGLRTIAFTPENLPGIYGDTAYWYDRAHMTREGARIVSREVGRRLCRLAKGA